MLTLVYAGIIVMSSLCARPFLGQSQGMNRCLTTTDSWNMLKSLNLTCELLELWTSLIHRQKYSWKCRKGAHAQRADVEEDNPFEHSVEL